MAITAKQIRDLITKWWPGQWHSLEGFRICVENSGLLDSDDYSYTGDEEIKWHHAIRNCVQTWKRNTPRGYFDLSWDSENHLYRVEVPKSELLIRYPPLFADTINDDPKLDENNDGEGVVYFMSNPLFKGWTKIGCTKNLKMREQSYQTYSPRKYTVDAYILEEKCFNLEQRIHNEILRPNPDFESIREWHNISFDEAINLISKKIDGLSYCKMEEKKSLFDF